METTGIVRTISEPQTVGNNTKQFIKVESGGKEIELLLFNRSELIEGIKTGDAIKALYNAKEYKGAVTNYLNKLERLNAKHTSQSKQSAKHKASEAEPEQSSKQEFETVKVLTAKGLVTFSNVVFNGIKDNCLLIYTKEFELMKEQSSINKPPQLAEEEIEFPF